MQIALSCDGGAKKTANFANTSAGRYFADKIYNKPSYTKFHLINEMFGQNNLKPYCDMLMEICTLEERAAALIAI